MIFKKFFILALFITFLEGYGQKKYNLDSLLTLSRTLTEDTNKVNILNSISTEYNSFSPEKAIEYAKKASELSKKLSYVKGEARSYKNIGLAHVLKGEHKNSIKFYEKSMELYKSIHAINEIAKLLKNIGNSYRNINENDQAINNYYAGLSLAMECKDSATIAGIYNGFGNIHLTQLKYDSAIFYYLKALKIDESLNNTKGIFSENNNIGNVFLGQKNYTKALEYFKKALIIARKENDQKELCASLNNVGLTYYELNDYPNALGYLLLTLKIKKQIGNKNSIAETLSIIGHVYFAEKEYKKAIETYLKAYNFAVETKNKQYQLRAISNLGYAYSEIGDYTNAIAFQEKHLSLSIELGSNFNIPIAYKSLSKIHEKHKKYKKAYEYLNLYSNLNDSLYSAESTKQVAEMQIKYETEKKESQIKLLEAVAKNEKQTRNIFIISFTSIAIIILLVYGRYRAKEKLLLKNKEIKILQEKTELEQKLLRNQMNPHFIFNSFDIIQSLIVNNKNEAANLYLTKFAKLTRDILENSREEFIVLREEISTLINYLDLQQLFFSKSFIYSVKVDENIDLDNIMIPPMLAQPFIENALKHGVKKTTKNGEINIHFYLKNNKLIFEITDNGPGINTNEQSLKNIVASDHKSLATIITKERINNLNRNRNEKLKIDIRNILNDNTEIIGTIVTFEIPYTYEF